MSYLLWPQPSVKNTLNFTPTPVCKEKSPDGRYFCNYDGCPGRPAAAHNAMNAHGHRVAQWYGGDKATTTAWYNGVTWDYSAYAGVWPSQGANPSQVAVPINHSKVTAMAQESNTMEDMDDDNLPYASKEEERKLPTLDDMDRRDKEQMKKWLDKSHPIPVKKKPGDASVAVPAVPDGKKA